MAQTATSALKRYARLHREKMDLEAKLKQTKAELEETSASVIEYFQRHGVDSVKVNGVTMYLRRELWAGKESNVSDEILESALLGAGLSEYLRLGMNTQGVSALARECDSEGSTLQQRYPALEGVIKVSEVFKVGARTS